jgi:hypothetical protein
MTITDVRIPQPRTADHDTTTPESQRLAQLQEMLDDPDYAGFRAEILASIADLTATSVLRA